MTGEDLCLRCGECCRFKFRAQTGDYYLADGRYCPHLGWRGSTAFCEVYDTRIGKLLGYGASCMPVDLLVRERVMPNYCPYTKKVFGYRTLVLNFRSPTEIAIKRVAIPDGCAVKGGQNAGRGNQEARGSDSLPDNRSQEG